MRNEISVRKIKEGEYAVKAVLGNGYEKVEFFNDASEESVIAYANGIQAGLVLSLNAIGFVGSPKIEV